MAKLINVSPGMTMSEAQQVGARNSWLGAGAVYFDPVDEPEPLAPIENGSSALTVPEIAGRVAEWSKDGMLGQIKKGTMSGPLRDTRGRYGDPKEWDHISFTFTRDESARLRELGEDVQERLRHVIANVLRQHPSAPDMNRQMVMTQLHESTGNFHFHALLHRHAVKAPSDGALEVSASIDMMRSSEVQSVAQSINHALTDAGLGEFQIREATVGDNDVFGERGSKPATALNEQAEPTEARDDAMGADPGQSIYEQARTLTPSENTLKRMVEVQNKRVADAQKALEEAQRMQEGFQNLLAAEAQKNDALRAQQLAEDRAEIALAAQAEAEQQAAQAREAERVAVENAAHAAKQAEEARKDAEAAEHARAATEERLVAANTQIGGLEDKVEALNADLEERDEQIAELSEVAGRVPELEASLSVAEERLSQSEKVIAKREDELSSLKAEREVDAKAHEQAIQALKAEHAAQLRDAVAAARQEATDKAQADATQRIALLTAQHSQVLSEQRAESAERVARIEGEHSKEKSKLQSVIDGLRERVDGLEQQLADARDNVRRHAALIGGKLQRIFQFRHEQGVSTLEADMKTMDSLSKNLREKGFPSWAKPSATDEGDLPTELGDPFGLSSDEPSDDDDGPKGPGES